MAMAPRDEDGYEASDAGPRRRLAPLPHRGAAVLTLGIVGVVVCFICAIIAWVMGQADLKAMRAGSMDASGEGITRAGWVLGIIGTCLGALWLLLFVSGALALPWAAREMREHSLRIEAR